RYRVDAGVEVLIGAASARRRRIAVPGIASHIIRQATCPNTVAAGPGDGERLSGAEGQDSIRLPTAHKRIECPAHRIAELLTSAERQLVVEAVGEAVANVPSRCGIAAAVVGDRDRSEIARPAQRRAAIGQRVAPNVRRQELQAVAEALLEFHRSGGVVAVTE